MVLFDIVFWYFCFIYKLVSFGVGEVFLLLFDNKIVVLVCEWELFLVSEVKFLLFWFFVMFLLFLELIFVVFIVLLILLLFFRKFFGILSLARYSRYFSVNYKDREKYYCMLNNSKDMMNML